MVQIDRKQPAKPLELAVTGEATHWVPAIGKIVGPRWVHALQVRTERELLHVVRDGAVDAAVLDESGNQQLDVLPLLRMIRRVDQNLPVVVVTRHTDRQWMENALRLAAFSVVAKPMELEEFLRQIHSIMARLHRMLRETQPPPQTP